MIDSWVNNYWYLLVALAIWELVWKGMGLWKAAQNNDKAWFVLILILNTVGILPIAYIYIFSKRHPVSSGNDK